MRPLLLGECPPPPPGHASHRAAEVFLSSRCVSELPSVSAVSLCSQVRLRIAAPGLRYRP